MDHQIEPLHVLAAAAGLQRHWRDVDGREHVVADGTLVAVLAALGFKAGNKRAIARSLALIEAEHYRLPALVVAEAGRGHRAALHLRRSAGAALGRGGKGARLSGRRADRAFRAGILRLPHRRRGNPAGGGSLRLPATPKRTAPLGRLAANSLAARIAAKPVRHIWRTGRKYRGAGSGRRGHGGDQSGPRAGSRSRRKVQPLLPVQPPIRERRDGRSGAFGPAAIAGRAGAGADWLGTRTSGAVEPIVDAVRWSFGGKTRRNHR